jgi:hypothetical protein
VLPASIGGVSGWRRAGRVEARHWTGEGKSRHGGERARPAATGSRFKGGGSQWRGFEGARPMRGGSGEEQGGVG